MMQLSTSLMRELSGGGVTEKEGDEKAFFKTQPHLDFLL